MNINFKTLALVTIMSASITACYQEDDVNKPVKEQEESDDPLDQYIMDNFTDKYGVAVRYEYVDRYVEGDRRVSPPEKEIVQPMLEFLTEYWIEPFINVPNGKKFFQESVPAEVVLIGSTMYNSDGTVTLGTADAGARITLTEVNDLNPENLNWVFRQLGTIYHEFAHIVHQNHGLPANWLQISPEGYTNPGSWYNLTDEQALKRGFVSPYGTSSENEDFAELAAFILYDPDFYTKYYDYETCGDNASCLERNEGRTMIRTKYTTLLAHYEQYTGVDLLAVRELIQAKF